MTWQTIDRAPKDGTEVLVWDGPGEPFVAFWHGKRSKWLWTVRDLNGDEVLSPTHWQPLPAPPET